MTIKKVSKQDFDLIVRVSDNSSGLKVGGKVLEQVFRGTLGGILEFETPATHVGVKGAIAVGIKEVMQVANAAQPAVQADAGALRRLFPRFARRRLT